MKRAGLYIGVSTVDQHPKLNCSICASSPASGSLRSWKEFRPECEGPSPKGGKLDVHGWTSTVKQVVEDRRSGMSLTVVAKRYANSRASVCRWMKELNGNSPAEEVLRSGRNTITQVSL